MDYEYIPISFSHLLGHSGPGSIVRGPRSLMVVRDTSRWTDKDNNTAATEILYVERARLALGISQKLYAPPAAKMTENNRPAGACIPASRFPRWMRCPLCGRLYPQSIWRNQDTGYPVCTNPAGGGNKCKGTRLEQVQFIMIHPEGHLADVDWVFMAHDKDISRCKMRDRLVLESINNKWFLRCEHCGIQTEFNDKEQQGFGYNNRQPWLYNEPAPESARSSGAIIIKVNDSRVYNPVTACALIIPPESRIRKGGVIDRLYTNISDRQLIADMEKELERARTGLQKKRARMRLETLADRYRCGVDEIEHAIKEIENGYPYYGQVFSGTQLYEDEYKAFLKEFDPPPSDDEDFVTHNMTRQWSDYINGDELPPVLKNRARIVKDLIKADRLKEIRVFKGFSRAGGDIVPPDIMGRADWLPAIELYGEGVFFTLDEELLAVWEEKPEVTARMSRTERRFAASGRKDPQRLTPRFLLLHTLAHLIIRQLEAEGGYPAASLTERLYCNPHTSAYPMSGILIYTTVSDKSGTLGGLAELCSPRSFLKILSGALDKAVWCSSDPVCGEHEGQGPDLLNLAACHGCVLIPDTACAYGNVLLDRVMVNGGL